jgi:hypothetical protein
VTIKTGGFNSFLEDGKDVMNKINYLTFFICPVSIFALILGSAAVVYADCTHNGQNYQTGQTVGPYVCMPDGSWRNRNRGHSD